MFKLISSLVIVFFFVTKNTTAQVTAPKFGSGIHVLANDSSFYLKLGFRFQNLHVSEWKISDGTLNDYQANFLVRRSRLKFDGWIHNSKLKYKLEIGLSNRDIGSQGDEFRNANNLILDASLSYNFYKNWTIQFGQRKLPGNRERIISSGNLQFVDRSMLNSRFNIDRDIGLQLINHHTIGKSFLIKETIALSQGEGRNVTEGNFGGFGYTFKAEFFPFGDFASKGAYVGSAIKNEEKLKLAWAFAYDININAVRERGQLGRFIVDENETYYGKTLKTFFSDIMLKYKGLSIMAEYVNKKTSDDNPIVYADNDEIVGVFFTGNALNLQGGYMFDNNWEIALRYTDVNPDAVVSSSEEQYTFGLSKFIVGHKLKIQSDLTYRNLTTSDNRIIFRTQLDVHF